MKQQYILIFFTFLLPSISANAQHFRWLTGGGSTAFLNNGAVKGEWITHMCTDDNGNVYSLAQVGNANIKADTFFQQATTTSDWKILFLSHDCNGNMRFAKLLESNSNNNCQGLTYYAGKVYVAGDLYNTGKRIGYDASFNTKWQRAFIAKFDTTGTFEWLKFVGPDSFSTYAGTGGSPTDLSVDGQGNVHYFATIFAGVEITPSITSQWGSYDLKYDPNGNLLSVYKLQDIDSNFFIRRARIDKTTNRSYVLFEYGGGTTTRSGTALAAYNPNGTQIWKDTTNIRAGFSLFTIKDNAIYYTASNSQAFGPFTIKGMQVNNSLSSTGYIAIMGKLDIANGNPQWMYHVDGTNSVNSLYDITVLPDYSIAVFGTYAGFKKYRADTMNTIVAEGWNPVLFVIDTMGNLVNWEQMHGSGFADNSSGGMICSDKKGNIYVGGKTEANMQAGNLPTYVKNGGNSDYYLAKFGFDCNCTGMANPTSAFTYTIKDSLKKEIQFTFTGTTPNDSVVWRFGDASVLTQTNPTHIFADTGVYTVCAKVMVPCGRKVICQDIYVPYYDTTDTADNIVVINALEHVRIYPNPANDVLHVDGIEPGCRIELYDIVGRKAHMIVTAKENETVNISYLPSGNYIIHITNSKGHRMTGKVVKR